MLGELRVQPGGSRTAAADAAVRFRGLEHDRQERGSGRPRGVHRAVSPTAPSTARRMPAEGPARPGDRAAAWTKLQGSERHRGLRDLPAPLSERDLRLSASQITLQGLLSAQLATSGDVAGMQAFIARFPDAPPSPSSSRRDGPSSGCGPAPPRRRLPPATPPAAARAEVPPVAATEPAPVVTPPASDDITVAMAEPPTAPAPSAVARGRWRRACPYPRQPAFERARCIRGLADADRLASGGGPVAGVDPATQFRAFPHYLIQIALKALDYYHGTLDDNFGPASRRSAAATSRRRSATDPTGDLQPTEIVTLIAGRRGSATPFHRTPTAACSRSAPASPGSDGGGEMVPSVRGRWRYLRADQPGAAAGAAVGP